jgi:hypothetical protein
VAIIALSIGTRAPLEGPPSTSRLSHYFGLALLLITVECRFAVATNSQPAGAATSHGPIARALTCTYLTSHAYGHQVRQVRTTEKKQPVLGLTAAVVVVVAVQWRCFCHNPPIPRLEGLKRSPVHWIGGWMDPAATCVIVGCVVDSFGRIYWRKHEWWWWWWW